MRSGLVTTIFCLTAATLTAAMVGCQPQPAASGDRRASPATPTLSAEGDHHPPPRTPEN